VDLLRKVTVLLIMLFIVITCVTAALCYSAAVVQSPAVLKVVSTNEALLALIPAEELEETGSFCTIDSGVLYFNFSGGEGLTTGSSWEWPHFFTVQNNSAENIKFTIENNGIPFINLKAWASGSYPESAIVMVEDGNNKGNFYPLLPGETAKIAVSFSINENEIPVSENGTLTVISEAE
jgi:hypothetical protein